MADGQGTFGGDGSVSWLVKVKDGDTPNIETETNPRKYKVKSKDENGPEGHYFKVTIKSPNPFEMKNGTLTTYVKIANVKEQISIEWPIKPTDVPTVTATRSAAKKASKKKKAWKKR